MKIKGASIHFLFLLFGVFAVPTSASEKPCHLSNLHAEEVKCETTTNLTSSVHSGSFCSFKCGQNEVPQGTTCMDGLWNNGCSKLAPTPRRKKRFIKAFFCFLFCRRRSRPRDNTPPRLTCPPDITKVADKYQTYTKVSWSEPMAYDDRDGNIRPTRIGRRPGTVYSGTSTIKYYARDRSRNMATCSFRIKVQVIQCQSLSPIPNGYFICFPGFDYRYGSRCTFGCYLGHKLVGKRDMECLRNGQWSAVVPSCKKVTCKSPPPSVAPLSYNCSDGNNYRSICTYRCSMGYDIRYGQSRVRICSALGEWQGSVPDCVDVEPPKIMECQGASYGYTDRNSTYGTASWIEPYAIDNHDSQVRVVKHGAINNGDVVEAGIYHVMYTSEDSFGNRAQPCKIKIVMKVLTCNVVYPVPHLTVTCPGGNKYGAMCTFSCNVGSQLNGSSVAVCEKAESGIYATWTYGTQQPYCDVFEKCKTTPNIPKYGALACDNWLGGKFCQLLCKDGYDLNPGFHFYEMLVCSEDGEWQPSNLLPLPDCIKTELTSTAKLRMTAYYYFTGDCHDPAVQYEIRENFISALSSSLFKDACLIHAKECVAANVQVYCGLSKRSAELRIDFSLVLTLDESDFIGSFSDARSGVDDISNIVWTALVNESTSIFPNSTIEMKPSEFSSGDLELDCQNNSIPSYPTLSCVKCGPGTYFQHRNNTCVQCLKGTYQQDEGESECLPCPFGQTTITIGSISINDCQDGCPIGTWSPNGLPPCSLCPVGSYSDMHSSEMCKSCNGSKTTKGEGTKQGTDCKEFDLLLTNSTSVITSKFKDMQYTVSAAIAFWAKVDSEISLDISSENLTLLRLTIGDLVSIESTSWEHQLNRTLRDSRWHFILVNIENQSTKVSVDNEVVVNISTPYGFLRDMIYSEISVTGIGTISQLNIWSNKSDSEERHDTLPMKCSNDEVGDIFNWKQFESGTGEDVFRQIPSECDDFDDCASSPCNKGVCTDEGKTYSCSCQHGFSGENCEINADDCLENVCENNATCVDGDAMYTCACANGFTGLLCEILITDGGWSNWTEWSSCSKTCGNGTKHRTRKCNNPTPDNGGENCQGNDTQSMLCVEQEICPYCRNLTAPENSTLFCNADAKGSFNCTLECDPGFDFDHTPKQFYICGPDTFFLWDFESDDNVYKRLPFCSEITTTDQLSATYSARYQNLSCFQQKDPKQVHEVILNKVQSSVDFLSCRQSGVCTVRDISVAGCQTNQVEPQNTYFAGFNILFDCDSKTQGSEVCYIGLNTAVSEMNDMAANTSLDVMIDTTWYDISLNDTSAEGIVQCPSGLIEVKYYCVPCAIGNYLGTYECIACGMGTYQDETGQASCKQCPEGMTTPGEGSISIAECVVIPIHPQKDPVARELIAGLTSGGVVLLVIVIGVMVSFSIRRKKTTKKAKLRKPTYESQIIVSKTTQMQEMTGVENPSYMSTADSSM